MAEPKFEKDLEKLEEIVAALEEGGLSLDDSLKRFEEGIKLARRCEKALTAAEKRIEILVKDAKGNISAESFGDEEEDDADEADGAEDEVGEPGGNDKDGEGLLF